MKKPTPKLPSKPTPKATKAKVSYEKKGQSKVNGPKKGRAYL